MSSPIDPDEITEAFGDVPDFGDEEVVLSDYADETGLTSETASVNPVQTEPVQKVALEATVAATGSASTNPNAPVAQPVLPSSVVGQFSPRELSHTFQLFGGRFSEPPKGLDVYRVTVGNEAERTLFNEIAQLDSPNLPGMMIKKSWLLRRACRKQIRKFVKDLDEMICKRVEAEAEAARQAEKQRLVAIAEQARIRAAEAAKLQEEDDLRQALKEELDRSRSLEQQLTTLQNQKPVKQRTSLGESVLLPLAGALLMLAIEEAVLKFVGKGLLEWLGLGW